MNNNLRIVFPKGGGSSWLSSLIWNLTIGNWAIPNIDVNFDLNDSIEQIKPKFYHLQLDALEFVRPYTFIWKQ